MSEIPTGPVQEVLGSDFKKPFVLLVAVVVSVVIVIGALGKAEDFVDGRVELKLTAQREKSEEQAAKLQRMEEQFALMRDTLAEIRADVRVLRSRVEGREVQSPAPRSAP